MENIDFSMVKLKISDKKGNEATKKYLISDAEFRLNDDLVKEVMLEKKMDDIDVCTLIVGLRDAAVIIRNYSLTENVYIDAFYNVPSTISILQAKNINIQIEKQTIDNLQIDCPKVILADCKINRFDAGVNNFSLEESDVGNFEFDEIKIMDCNIHCMQMFHNCKYFTVQRCNINVLNMNGSMRAKAATIEKMLIEKYSNIGTMTMQYAISDFELKESTVLRMIAKGGCHHEITNIDFAGVHDSYYFTKDNFSQMNVGTWSIISKSASNQGLLNERAEAQYHIVKETYEQKNIHSLCGKFINFCTGYGYKPFRALFACLLMIVASWGLLEIIDTVLFFLESVKPTRSCMDNLLIAITAVIGQSGMTIEDGCVYWITYGEYIGAVILFAMFVNALYIRYRD